MSTVNRSSGTGRSRDAAGTTGTGTDRQVREVHLDALHHPGHHQHGHLQQRVRHQAEAAPQPDVRLPQEVQPDVRHHQAAFQLPEIPLLIEVRDDAEETLIMG